MNVHRSWFHSRPASREVVVLAGVGQFSGKDAKLLATLTDNDKKFGQ